MDIDFTGEYIVNDNDVTFYAIANDQTVACVVSKAALNDMENTDSEDSAEKQFEDNQYKLEEIAEALMRNHQIVDGEIHISHTEL